MEKAAYFGWLQRPDIVDKNITKRKGGGFSRYRNHLLIILDQVGASTTPHDLGTIHL